MVSRWHWVLRQISQKLWVVAALYTALGIATAFLWT